MKNDIAIETDVFRTLGPPECSRCRFPTNNQPEGVRRGGLFLRHLLDTNEVTHPILCTDCGFDQDIDWARTTHMVYVVRTGLWERQEGSY